MGLAILTHFRHAHECGHQKGWHHPQLYSSERLHETALYIVTNLFAGVDGLVWQTEHRLHHAYTLCDRDPQIPMRPGALLPICSVDEPPLAEFIAHNPLGSTLLRWQEVFFLPFLTVVGKHYLAYLTLHRIDAPAKLALGYPKQDPWLRKLLLLGHYALLCTAMWLLVWRPNMRRKSRWRNAQCCALWFLGCSIGAGLIEPMFLFNHVQTGRSTHDTASDKVAQMCHTINYEMRLPWWLPVDELLTPVAYHIEHHIDPKVPDENLPRITADIQRVASQYGVPFRTQRIEVLAWDYVLQLARVPRDRWGGAGAFVPMLLVVAIATLCWPRAHPVSSRRRQIAAMLDGSSTRAWHRARLEAGSVDLDEQRTPFLTREKGV